MGKAITTILILVILAVGAYWIWGRGDNNLANNSGNATSTENLTGTGGPENGFDPLNTDDNGNTFDEQGKG